VDVDVLGSYPHAHYLGHDMQGLGHSSRCEEEVAGLDSHWDIDRQSVYRYREPIFLPKGTVLHMRYIYDNSAATRTIPHVPPRAGSRPATAQ